MRKKLPGNLTVEDLLDSLNQEETVEVAPQIQHNNDVLSFLMTFNIKAGEEPVKLKLLYQLYSLWSKKPVHKSTFGQEINKYLPDTARCYLVDISAWKISEEIQKVAMKGKVDKTKWKGYRRHFENYLKKYDIKAGTYYVKSYVLFYLYDKWVYGIKKARPLGERQFFNFCQLYFKSKRNNKSALSWFAVDKTSLFKVITMEQILRIERAHKEKHDKKKKKKSPKQQSVPRC